MATKKTQKKKNRNISAMMAEVQKAFQLSPRERDRFVARWTTEFQAQMFVPLTDDEYADLQWRMCNNAHRIMQDEVQEMTQHLLHVAQTRATLGWAWKQNTK